MEATVFNFNEEHHLFKKGDTLFLAVSGGPDSLALLHFFASIQESWELKIVTLTVDHQLRGQESLDDAKFVQSECERLGIPCRVGHVDVSDYKKQKQVSTQVAAREMRYQFFTDCMKGYNHSKLVLGHHQDDLTETMLMQFIKGVRPKGLPVRRNFGDHEIIRPFLSVSKDDILTFINKNNLNPRMDPSNEEDTYTRNRIRNQLIPLLVKENPGLPKSLKNLQGQLNEDEDLLQSLAYEQFSKMVELRTNSVTFSITEFNDVSVPLQRRIFHLILNYLYTHEMMDKDYFNTFKEWMQSDQKNSQFQVNQQFTLIKAYDECQVLKGSKTAEMYHNFIDVGETLQLPNGWTVFVEEVESAQEVGDDTLLCDKHHILLPLTVRTRNHGDRIKPKGMNGHKKVKDIFIDQKIPRHLRDEWPMVESNGEIIWIPYVCKSHLAEDSGQNLIQITFHK